MPYDDCHALGGMTPYGWEMDPKRLAFQLARYRVVARLIEGRFKVLEVGCADGWGSRIVRQHVAHLDAVDVDKRSIEEARDSVSSQWPVRFFVHDIMAAGKRLRGYDAVYCLDLFEHISDDSRLLKNLRACAPMCVIGTPSIESQRYASDISRREHVNCVSKATLRERMCRHWRHVIMLGMNDETLHVGFDAMTHYLIGIGCN